MSFRFLQLLCVCSVFAVAIPRAIAQTSTSSDGAIISSLPASSSATDVTFATLTSFSNGSSTGTATSSATASTSSPPDVLLNVPNLSVEKIELIVDDLEANINLNAKVANLVTLNAGVALSVETVNITIADVSAELELIVRLGQLVNVVNRVFKSLDLNPLLITALNDVTGVVDTAVGVVTGLLGQITQNGGVLDFIIDNLGNIVQSVTNAAGEVTNTIVGDYLTNMTFTGEQQTLSGGNIQKTYSYAPLNALVNIVFNTLGQIVSTNVIQAGGTASSATSAVASATSSLLGSSSATAAASSTTAA